MNLDKYIGENIDDILDNLDNLDNFNNFSINPIVFDSITNKKPFELNNKKVSFGIDKKIKSKDSKLNNANSFSVPNSNIDSNIDSNPDDYYDKIYGDIYQDDFDDFGYVYNLNNSNDSDDLDDSDVHYNNDNHDDTNDYNEYNNEKSNQIPIHDVDLYENEDDYTEDIISELYQNLYQSKMEKEDVVETFKNLSQSYFDNFNQINQIHQEQNPKQNSNSKPNPNPNPNEFDKDDGYYFINLINIFMKYYNNKFDKIENFFSGIKDNHSGTSQQMELFFDAIVEYKTVKNTFKIDNDNICMELIYEESDTDSNNKILELFSKWENQIYMLDFGIKRYISPSLLICLNYIYENKITDEYWDIYNLRNV